MENKFDNKIIISSLWWKLSERVFSQGINLLVQIILARILLPKDFGSLAIIAAITNYAAYFVQSGLSTVLIQKKNLDEKDTATMLTASLAVALFFFIVLFCSASYISVLYETPELLWPLRVLSLVLFLNAINSVQTALLSRTMNFRLIFLRSAISVPIAGAVGIFMAYYGFGIWALVTHNLLSMLIMVLVMFIGTDLNFKLGFSIEKAKQMYAFSIKILISNLISGFGDTIRTMMIGKKYNTIELAYYDKAYTYSSYVVHIIHSSIQSVMLPVMSRQQDDLVVLKETNRKTVSMVSFVMFPILLGACVTAEPFIILLLTEKWANCVSFFALFCFFRLVGCITSVDKQAYYALGKSGIVTIYEIGLLVANLTMLFLLIKKGVWAIAVGATVVEVIGCFVLCVISSRLYGYNLLQRFQDIKRPLFNSLIMISLIYMISILGFRYEVTFGLQILIGVLVYFFMAKLSKDQNLPYFTKIIFNKK